MLYDLMYQLGVNENELLELLECDPYFMQGR